LEDGHPGDDLFEYLFGDGDSGQVGSMDEVYN
jgi:hypothetical protein